MQARGLRVHRGSNINELPLTDFDELPPQDIVLYNIVIHFVHFRFTYCSYGSVYALRIKTRATRDFHLFANYVYCSHRNYHGYDILFDPLSQKNKNGLWNNPRISQVREKEKHCVDCINFIENTQSKRVH